MTDIAAELKERTTGGRYLELDGLRGLTAFTVVWHHLWFMYSLPRHWYEQPLIAGHEAVMVFFILSGLVLSLPYWNRGTNGPYFPYLVRRFFRIYVPFAVAPCLAAVAAAWLGGRNLPLSYWFYLTWHTPVTPKLLLSQFLMSPTSELNTAFWSLRYEVQMSILFPLLVALLSKIPSAAGWIGATAVYLFSNWLRKRGVPDPHYLGDLLRYGSMFAYGALIGRNRATWRSLSERAKMSGRAAFLALSLSFYWGYAEDVFQRLHLPTAHELMTVAGACGIVISVLNFAVFRDLLRSAVAEYLGRISYSLYLVHGTILFALVSVLYTKLNVLWIGVLLLTLSLGTAHLFCVLIEEPSLRLGKRLAARSGVPPRGVNGSKGTFSKLDTKRENNWVLKTAIGPIAGVLANFWKIWTFEGAKGRSDATNCSFRHPYSLIVRKTWRHRQRTTTARWV